MLRIIKGGKDRKMLRIHRLTTKPVLIDVQICTRRESATLRALDLSC